MLSSFQRGLLHWFQAGAPAEEYLTRSRRWIGMTLLSQFLPDDSSNKWRYGLSGEELVASAIQPYGKASSQCYPAIPV